MSFLKYLKFVPLALDAIDSIVSLLHALRDRADAVKKNQKTDSEDQIIKRERMQLTNFGYQFIPADVQAYASQAEINNFGDKVILAVNALVAAVEAFLPLIKKG